MAKPQWTTGQQHCIDARGGTVLVSAAAGSGKTAVLIERIVSLICDPTDPVDVEKLLVVTFTKAAAAEMRSRLNRRLSEEISADPHNRRLLRQQMLLPQAMICTIDSFCIQLLREYAAQAHVSPRFRVADETALNLIKHDTARQVIDEAYRAGDPAFLQLCGILTDDRSDAKLTEELLRTYNFIQAHPFPLQWLDRQQKRFETDGDIADTIWGQILLAQATDHLQAAALTLSAAIDDMAHDEAISAAYGPSLAAALDATLESIKHLNGSWDEARNAVLGIRFPAFGSLRQYEDEDFKKHITAMRDHAKKLIATVADDLLGYSSEQARFDIAACAPAVGAMFDLVRTFTAQFSAAKAEQNMLDFNDTEHRLLSLLATPNDDGSFTRTEAAKEIGARFAHIMVDEYQDTNATQDTLFAALSDDERNLFFVGDLKQSIYGFRQAMPTIFQGRRQNSTAYDGVHYPASITLGNNFRSRSQVAEITNFVFRRLMTAKTGGIVYNENEELVASAAFPDADSDTYDAELIITDRQEHPEALSRHHAEARIIGERIRELIEQGFQVTEKGGTRQATYRDFCILMRSTAGKAPIFIRELQAMGIPTAADTRENLFDCAEIKLIMSVLRTIDNPLLDVPMLATLMSPVYGFSPDDVAMIRSVAQNVPLFSAIRKAARSSLPCASSCRYFLEDLKRYRMLAAAMPADRLIRRLYEDSDLLSIMSAKSGGSSRIANLRKFYDLARRFEDHDFRGLPAFIRHMTRLEEKGIALPTADGAQAQNAVRLMTIHHSKGLEFPVVFLAGLGNDINRMSTRGDILLHAEHGIGITHRDRETMTESNPIHRRAIATAIKRSESAEELRVLYVAMTRAKDKLIMLATVDNIVSTLHRLRIQATGFETSFTPSFVLNASSMSDWVIAAAMQHPAGKLLQDRTEFPTGLQHEQDGLTIRIQTPPQEIQKLQVQADVEQSEASIEWQVRLQYEYPYSALGQVAAKITASQTAHNNDNEQTVYLRKPSFTGKGGLTPAERGTATHLFMEHVDLTHPHAREQAEAMIERDILTAQQLHALDLPRLQQFLESDIAARMARADVLLREFPFTVDRPIGDFIEKDDSMPSDAWNETVLVQGIADAVFEESGELVIVDYKTDRVGNIEDLAARYRPQLMIYKEALSRALQRPVKDCVIYSFHLNKTISV